MNRARRHFRRPLRRPIVGHRIAASLATLLLAGAQGPAHAALIAAWNFNTVGNNGASFGSGGYAPISGAVTSGPGTTVNAVSGDVAGSGISFPFNTSGTSIGFGFTTNNATGMTLSYAANRAAPAYNSTAIEWSLDGTSYFPITGSPTSFPTGGFATQTFNLPSQLDNVGGAFVRFSFSGGSAGSAFMDNLQINGTPGTPPPLNDSTLWVGGAPAADGSSNLGITFFGALLGHAPGSGGFAIRKTGTQSTNFTVNGGGLTLNTTGGAFTGPTNLINIDVQVPSQYWSTRGHQTWGITVDNTATTSAAAGQGSADLNDVVNIATDFYDAGAVSFNTTTGPLDTGQDLQVISASNAGGLYRASIQLNSRTLTGANASYWSLSGLNTGTLLAPNTLATITPTWVATGLPNGTYGDAAIQTVVGNDSSIGGAAIGDVNAGVTVALSHTVTNSSGGAVNVSNGQSYAGYGARTSHTTAKLLYGTASGARTINIHMQPNDPIQPTDPIVPIGDRATLDITGYAGEPFVLDLSYDESQLGSFIESDLRLYSRVSSADVYQLSVAANAGGTGTFFAESFSEYLATHPTPTAGDYGLDTAGNHVWAVLTHNSDFVVAVPTPEPVAAAIAAFALIAAPRLTRRHRRTK